MANEEAKVRKDPFLDPGFMKCPHCGQVNEDPQWRLKIILRRKGLPCGQCGKGVKLVGNHWFALLVSGGLFLLGGRLHSQEYSLLLSAVFFLGGVGVLGWGILNAKLSSID